MILRILAAGYAILSLGALAWALLIELADATESRTRRRR